MKIIEELREAKWRTLFAVEAEPESGMYSISYKNAFLLMRAADALIEIAGVEKLEPKIASYEIGHNAALDLIQEIIERNMG